MAKERAVVVGAGGISGAWFPPLQQEKVQIVGVVDQNLEAARKAIEKYGLACPAADNLAATLKQTSPDFVVDLTIPDAHCAVTTTALAAGCHVIGEKPMAPTMAQARKMVSAAENAGKLYMVSQSYRFSPEPDVARRVVQGRKLGDVTTINADFYIGAHFGGFRDEMASPLILDLSIHHFDMARFLTGLDAVSVYAHEFNPHRSWYKGDAAASCIFEMSNGAIFTYRGSWCAEGFNSGWNGNWRIIGNRGSLLWENGKPPEAQVVAGTTGFNRPLKEVKLPAATVRHNGMHGALRDMLAFLRTGKVPPTECHDNIKSLAMVQAAIESSKKGRRVPISAS